MNKKIHLLFQLTIFINLYTYNTANALTKSSTNYYCGNIKIQPPFSIRSTRKLSGSEESLSTTPLNHLLLCKSNKLYLRTSLGLFPVSSVDYISKLLIISHPSSFSSLNKFIPPSLLTMGFPTPPPLPNSVVLLNCSSSSSSSSSKNLTHHEFPTIRNCTHFNFHGGEGLSSSCLLLVDDVSKLRLMDVINLTDNKVKCSHYRRVYRRSLNGDRDDGGAYDLGTRISFEIPNHVRNICDECEKPDGHCGVGLKCICHAKECRDDVINMSPSFNKNGIFAKLVAVIVTALIVLDFWTNGS